MTEQSSEKNQEQVGWVLRIAIGVVGFLIMLVGFGACFLFIAFVGITDSGGMAILGLIRSWGIVIALLVGLLLSWLGGRFIHKYLTHFWKLKRPKRRHHG